MFLSLVIATKHRKVTFIAGSGEYSTGVEREKLEKTNAKYSHFSMQKLGNFPFHLICQNQFYLRLYSNKNKMSAVKKTKEFIKNRTGIQVRMTVDQQIDPQSNVLTLTT